MTDMPCLAIGAVLGDSDSESRDWGRAIREVSMEASALCAEVNSPILVNAVLHVDGRIVPNEFTGVRTGRYDRHTHVLVVQVAMGNHAPVDGDRRTVLVNLVADALDEAERYAKRRGLADSLPELRQVLRQLQRPTGQGNCPET
ncbi:hypothetical protein [Angustibacter luteus]|uniref:Uncharacterized protein n=1 Tax=Angustibacter luteus TaxID=658456 RepID=A0ABW1JDH2_9ACTN